MFSDLVHFRLVSFLKSFIYLRRRNTRKKKEDKVLSMRVERGSRVAEGSRVVEHERKKRIKKEEEEEKKEEKKE